MYPLRLAGALGLMVGFIFAVDYREKREQERFRATVDQPYTGVVQR